MGAWTSNRLRQVSGWWCCPAGECSIQTYRTSELRSAGKGTAYGEKTVGKGGNGALALHSLSAAAKLKQPERWDKVHIELCLISQAAII